MVCFFKVLFCLKFYGQINLKRLPSKPFSGDSHCLLRLVLKALGSSMRSKYPCLVVLNPAFAASWSLSSLSQSKCQPSTMEGGREGWGEKGLHRDNLQPPT